MVEPSKKIASAYIATTHRKVTERGACCRHFFPEMAGDSVEENPFWSALKEPLSSFVGGMQNNDAAIEEQKKAEAIQAARREEANRKRYRKRIQNLQMEVEEVNEAATKTRKLLWETQDKLKEKDDQIRQLQNHLNELLELRESDLAAIKSLRVANSDCVENENRAREAMVVFKKCYKRAQLKVKEQEEEIAVLHEQRERMERARITSEASDTTGMVSESALEYIQSVSNDKQYRLEKMLTETQADADIWKSKYKVAHKRCLNWQEQIMAMEHPSEGAAHIERQRTTIDKLEEKIRKLEIERSKTERSETERSEPERQDSRNPFESGSEGAFCNSDTRDGGLSKALLDGFQNFKLGSSCI